MTRAELLKRLQDMQASGQDMTLPIVMRVMRKVEDKRTRAGKRTEQLFATVDYACNSALSFGNDHGEAIKAYGLPVERPHGLGMLYVAGELSGYALTDFKR